MNEYFIDGIPVTKTEQDAYAGMSGLAKKSFELKLRDRAGIKDRSVKEQLLESAERHELTKAPEPIVADSVAAEYTGGSVSYYSVRVDTPFNPDSLAYVAECQDIINVLKLDFNEGSAFKAIWRRAVARQGKQKRGYDNGLYDAEKVEFFGNQMKRTTPIAPQESN